jgi:hypothetical protein
MPLPHPDILPFFSSVYTHPANEGSGVSVTLWTGEVLGSKLDRNTGYPDLRFCDYSTLQADAGIVHRLGHGSFFLRHFEFVIELPSRHSTLYRVFQEEGYSIGHSKQYAVHCTDEQHAMSSHEFQSALMLTVQFSEMYYTR